MPKIAFEIINNILTHKAPCCEPDVLHCSKRRLCAGRRIGRRSPAAIQPPSSPGNSHKLACTATQRARIAAAAARCLAPSGSSCRPPAPPPPRWANPPPPDSSPPAPPAARPPSGTDRETASAAPRPRAPPPHRNRPAPPAGRGRQRQFQPHPGDEIKRLHRSRLQRNACPHQHLAMYLVTQAENPRRSGPGCAPSLPRRQPVHGRRSLSVVLLQGYEPLPAVAGRRDAKRRKVFCFFFQKRGLSSFLKKRSKKLFLR